MIAMIKRGIYIIFSLALALSFIVNYPQQAKAGGIATYAGWDAGLWGGGMPNVYADGNTSYNTDSTTIGAPYAFFNHITFNFYFNSYDTYYGYTSASIEGWDGHQWVWITNIYPGQGNPIDTWSGWRQSTANFFTPIYQFRMRAYSRYPGYRCIFNLQAVSVGVYQFAADQQTAQTAADAAIQARDAANSTVSYAQQASQNASNASAAANSIINNYLSTANGIVQDSSGTVLTAARVASTNAQNAYNAAQNAVTGINNAQNALSSKIDSSTSTIGSKIDSSASSLQTNLGNKIDSSLSNLQTNLNNSITNIQSVMPPILTKVSGYNGATATKTGSINLTLDYSNATDYQIKVDNGAWGAWSSLSSLDTNGYITASGLSTTGVHTIYVQIRNGSNNPALAKGKFTCFEL